MPGLRAVLNGRPGEYECLACDAMPTEESVETYICHMCGSSLYFWPDVETTTYGVTVRFDPQSGQFRSKVEKSIILQA